MQPAPIVLDSGSIQYTPDPHATLASLLGMSPQFVILDKLPILDAPRWAVQRVHPSVFGEEVRFPQFYFGRERLLSSFDPYRVVMEWELPGYEAHIDGTYQPLYRGFLLAR